MTEGMKSSEFWLAALTLVCVTVLLGLGKITAQDLGAILGLTGSSLGYSVSRGLAKLNKPGGA
jgi:hypothetical protein